MPNQDNDEKFDIDHLTQVIINLPAQSERKMRSQKSLKLSASTLNEAKKRMRQIKLHDSDNLQRTAMENAVQQRQIMRIIRKMSNEFGVQMDAVVDGKSLVKRENAIESFRRIFDERVSGKIKSDHGKLKTAVIKMQAFFFALCGFLKTLGAIIITSPIRFISGIKEWHRQKKIFDKLEQTLDKKLSFSSKIKRFFRALDFSGRQKALNQALVEQYMDQHGSEVWNNVYDAFNAYKKNDYSTLDRLSHDFEKIVDSIQKQKLINGDFLEEEEISELDQNKEAKNKFGIVTGTLPKLMPLLVQKDENSKDLIEDDQNPIPIEMNYFSTLTNEEIYSLRSAIKMEREEYENNIIDVQHAQAWQSIAISEMKNNSKKTEEILKTAILAIDPDTTSKDFSVEELNILVDGKREQKKSSLKALEGKAREEITKFVNARGEIISNTKTHIQDQHETLGKQITIIRDFAHKGSDGYNEKRKEKEIIKSVDILSVFDHALNSFNIIKKQGEDVQYKDKNVKVRFFKEHLRQKLPGDGFKKKIDILKNIGNMAKISISNYRHSLEMLCKAIDERDIPYGGSKQKKLFLEAKKQFQTVTKELQKLQKEYEKNLDLIKKGAIKNIFDSANYNEKDERYKNLLNKLMGNPDSGSKGINGNTVTVVKEFNEKLKENQQKFEELFPKTHEITKITEEVAKKNPPVLSGFSLPETVDAQYNIAHSVVKPFMQKWSENVKRNGGNSGRNR